MSVGPAKTAPAREQRPPSAPPPKKRPPAPAKKDPPPPARKPAEATPAPRPATTRPPRAAPGPQPPPPPTTPPTGTAKPLAATPDTVAVADRRIKNFDAAATQLRNEEVTPFVDARRRAIAGEFSDFDKQLATAADPAAFRARLDAMAINMLDTNAREGTPIAENVALMHQFGRGALGHTAKPLTEAANDLRGLDEHVHDQHRAFGQKIDQRLREQEMQREQRRREVQQRERASADASNAYRAMRGGVTGWGTDEDALFRTLEGKTPAELDMMRGSYSAHYRRNLDRDVQSELSGRELTRAQALLRGDQITAAADGLREAMAGLGTNNEEVFRILQGKTPDEINKINGQYLRRYGRAISEDIRSDFSGAERDRALALLNGKGAQADAATLRQAMKGGVTGLGTDEQTVYDVLKGRSEKERLAIKQAYRDIYKSDLRGDIFSEFGGPELHRALGHLDGDEARAGAATLQQAMKGGLTGLGTDEKGVWNALDGKTAGERRAIEKAYRAQYGRDLRSVLPEEFSGTDLRRTHTLLERGKLTDAEKVYYGVTGLGTDEALVHGALRGKTKTEISAMEAEYRQKFPGRDLRNDLAWDLSGRDQFDAEQALKGRPETRREAVDRLNDAHAFERRGILNAPGRLLMDTLAPEHGANLDRNVALANQELARTGDGRVDALSPLADFTRFGHEDVGTYRAGKDSMQDYAQAGVASAAALAVTVGTFGTGTPLAATMLGAAAASATARVGTGLLVGGQGYGWENGLYDTGVGAMDGALWAAPALKVGKLATGPNPGLGGRMLARSLDMGVNGAWATGTSLTWATAIRDGTWDDGAMTGLGRVGRAGALGAGSGLAAGSVVGAARGAFPPLAAGANAPPDWKAWMTYVYAAKSMRSAINPPATTVPDAFAPER